VVLIAGSGALVLVDTADDRARDGTRSVLAQLRLRGVHELAGLVVTHADRDHGGGAAEILAALRVGRFVLPEPALDSPALREALREAARRGVPVTALAAGADWRLPGLRFAVLSPGAGTWGDDNDAGLVLRATLELSGLTVLLPADADERIETSLSRRGLLAASDVLVAGHHGARTSTSNALLRRVRPRVVLVSCGRNNRHGHPHPQTIARISSARVRWFDTARHGALAVQGVGERRLVVATNGRPRAVVPRQ
jgi:competence protein ComEC